MAVLLAGLPAAAHLPLSMFRAKFAPRIRNEELARIKPVMRSGTGTNGRQRALELFVVGASRMPQRVAFRDLVKREYFFDAAIAVGAHHKHLAFYGLIESQDHIMVELALLPVSE